MKRSAHLLVFLLSTLAGARAQVPQLIHYQGRVNAGGAPFQGAGQFKFAPVNSNGTTVFWSNDGTGDGGSLLNDMRSYTPGRTMHLYMKPRCPGPGPELAAAGTAPGTGSPQPTAG